MTPESIELELTKLELQAGNILLVSYPPSFSAEQAEYVKRGFSRVTSEGVAVVAVPHGVSAYILNTYTKITPAPPAADPEPEEAPF